MNKKRNTIPSRTLRLFDQINLDSVELKGVVSKTQSEKASFITFTSIDDAKEARRVLFDNKCRNKFYTYTAFYRMNGEVGDLTTEQVRRTLTEQISAKLTGSNVVSVIPYKHEGKMMNIGLVVLDRQEDLKTLVSSDQVMVGESVVKFFFYKSTKKEEKPKE